jgi:hypothetical protein
MAYIGRTPTGSILTGADIADGSISTAKLADTAVSTAKIADTAISTAKIADDAVTLAKAGFSAGKVLQVVSTTKTDSFSANAGGGSGGAGFVDVTGLSVNITPTSSSNKIYVTADVSVASESGSDFSTSASIRLLRDSTPIFVGTDATSLRTNTGRYFANPTSDSRNSALLVASGLDSPNTSSQVTFKIQVTNGYNISGRTVFVNRNPNSADNYSTFRMASTITAMEIAQ